MANRVMYDGSRGSTKAPVLLLMDSPRKEDGQRAAWPTKHSSNDEELHDSDTKSATSQVRRPSLTADAQAMMRSATTTAALASSSDSLGRLLVEMTAQVQDERSKRSDVEKKNQSLMLEIEQLQREVLDLKTSKEQQTRRRASGDWDAATRPDHFPDEEDGGAASPRDGNAEFWWRELQDAKKAKDQAQAESHHRAMEVMELNACISMQHDELKALRASEADVRFALGRSEERCKDMLQQHTVLVQESQLLRDEVAHLNNEIGKRGSHFKALMDKWSEAQAQTEHCERENRAMLDKMKELRNKHEHLQKELETLRDERDLLQHQVNHLKGAVAAKAAESKAFQAYGTNARDHLQAQNAMIQRHAIYRRKVHHIARDSVVLIKTIKSTLATVRAPLVTIQADFKTFLKNLQAPVLSLVARSRRYAETVHIEHQPLKVALVNAELTRRHLHEQLWRARRNALLVCQIRNAPATTATATASVSESILAMADPLSSTVSANDMAVSANRQQQRTLRANYGTGELLLRETDRDTLTVKCDAVFSDRARGAGCWNNYESVTPVLQSVLDGFNACVTTFDGLLPLKIDGSTPSDTMGVPELVLTQLFELLHANGAHFHRVKLTISFLGVYNEAIYDLLGLDPHGAAANATPATAQSMSTIVVLEVQNAEEALLVLRGGCENLELAHELGLLDKFLTHKVITVCVAHENLLLTGSAATKSKLQVVELATGPAETGEATTAADWEDRSKVKAHVAMENGVQALLTTLADVRVVAADSGGSSSASASSSFIRYHSSKLTVLLQDTIKANAKFLGVAALPGAVSSASAAPSSATQQQPQLDSRCAQATRWMFHLRNAVGSIAGASTGSHGSTDRSVEGFINRFTQQSQADAGSVSGKNGVGQTLAFSSSELLEKRAHGDEIHPKRWEKEYEGMKRRYGDLAKFTTSFYQPTPVASAVSPRASLYSSSDGYPQDESRASRAASPRRPTTSTVVNADELTDVVIRPHELVAVETGASGSLPPPAPSKAKHSKSRATVKSRVQGHRNGSKTATRRATTATMVGASDATVTTLAPQRMATTKATPMVKLRRETASSNLKKAMASHTTPASATASAVSGGRGASAASARAASAASGLAHAASTAAAAATLARLQKGKTPFK